MVFYIYKNASGFWSWLLRAASEKIIARSGENYFNKEDCIHAINLIRNYGSNASVLEE